MISPKNLFLLDGIGALVSAFLLGVVLVKFQNIIGMPVNVLYFLAALPCCFVLYDLYCYFQFNENWRSFMKGIAFANLMYCVISITSLFLHSHLLTTLGIAYFVGELIILFFLVCIEYGAAIR